MLSSSSLKDPFDDMCKIVNQYEQPDVPLSLTDRIVRKKVKSDLEAGHELVDYVRELCSRFDSVVGPRTLNQLRFLEGFMRANVGNFYRNNFDRDIDIICLRNKWRHKKQVQPVSAPRQEGKTEIMALFIAVMMYAIPKLSVLLLVPASSMGNNESGLLSKVKTSLTDIFGFKTSDFSRKNNKVLQFEKDSTFRTLNVEFVTYGKLYRGEESDTLRTFPTL